MYTGIIPLKDYHTLLTGTILFLPSPSGKYYNSYPVQSVELQLYHIMKFLQVCNTHSFFYHGDNDD